MAAHRALVLWSLGEDRPRRRLEDYPPRIRQAHPCGPAGSGKASRCGADGVGGGKWVKAGI
jgi:hypothetical protein